MDQAAGPGAAVFSLAGAGSAYSSIQAGKGTKAADEFRADQAERSAQFGRAQADLTDTVMHERLNQTLSNIDVIRAAGHVDSTSPTTMAVEDWNRMVSDRQRTAAVGSLRAQADEDEASASYLRQAGDFAVKQSYLSAGATILGGLGKAFAAGGLGASGSGGGGGGSTS